MDILFTKRLGDEVILSQRDEELQAGARNLARIKHWHVDNFVWLAGFPKIVPTSGDRFEVFGNSVEDFSYRMRVIDRGAEQRAALKSAGELAGELLHASDG